MTKRLLPNIGATLAFIGAVLLPVSHLLHSHRLMDAGMWLVTLGTLIVLAWVIIGLWTEP